MEKRKRTATATLFVSKGESKTAFHGEIELHEAVPAGTKLKVDLYRETSSRGNEYFRGPGYNSAALG